MLQQTVYPAVSSANEEVAKGGGVVADLSASVSLTCFSLRAKER